jgi:hypothetical protein
MSIAPQTPLARTALTLLNAKGNVTVDAGLPVTDLLILAEAAGKMGASMTLRRANVRPAVELEKIARAGRGRVSFDLGG